jgi:septum site-determining protein MinC
MLRGTKTGLEFVFTGRSYEEAWDEIGARLAERPDFYRGSRATAIFDEDVPEAATLSGFLEAVRGYGIEVYGIFGGEGLADLAREHGLEYLGPPQAPAVASFERKRAAKAQNDVRLTEKALSLDADFAGARAEIARRRRRGESSVRRPNFAPPAQAVNGKAEAARSVVPLAPAEPSTLYHRGTLRGGQSLQQLGNIVVIGDVNPGAELVASGDILVFGALRGTAHAGAQGDRKARVFALELSATQLRIGTFIAADDGKRAPREPEVAFVKGEGIAIAPYAKHGANK